MKKQLASFLLLCLILNSSLISASSVVEQKILSQKESIQADEIDQTLVQTSQTNQSGDQGYQSGQDQIVYWSTGHVFEKGSGERRDTRVIRFPTKFHCVPEVTVALTGFDASNGANQRIRLETSNINDESFTLTVITWADTKVYLVGYSWFASTPNPTKPDQHGTNWFAPRPSSESGNHERIYWSTGSVFENGNGGREETITIPFKTKFHRAPQVVVSLRGWDVSRAQNPRISIQLVSTSQTDFKFKIVTWADTKLYAVWTSWRAFVSDPLRDDCAWNYARFYQSPIVQAGFGSKTYWSTGHAMENGNGVRKDVIQVKFPRAFDDEPNVSIGFSGIDTAAAANQRYTINAQNVRKDGFEVLVTSWADSKVYLMQFTYIAYN